MLVLALAASLAGCIRPPPVPDQQGAYGTSGARSATLPFVLDDNRMFVDVAFATPDGAERKARAFVNMGSGAFVLSNALYRDLGIGAGKRLRLRLRGMIVDADPRAVQPEDMANSFVIALNPFGGGPDPAKAAQGPGGSMAALAAPMNVEAVIPPGLLQNFTTVFDYAARTITLAAPDTQAPDIQAPKGIAVPIAVDPRTGFATLDAGIEGRNYPAVIDNGGSYSAFRGGVVSDWIASHPAWLRSEGGIGESNLLMDGNFDVGVPVVKAPRPAFGPLALDELGAVAPGQGGMLGGLIACAFWDYYSDKAGRKVDGWIGGNVLKSFRLTLDYKAGKSYWLQQAPLDANDLDQVGITLVHAGAHTGIAGLAKKNGADTVAGVQPGDELLAIDRKPVAPMTRGEILGALHGTPGEQRALTLKRAGKVLTVETTVTAF
jgi:hypothetical protein